LPEDGFYVGFLRYIYLLTKTPAAKQELAKRQQELLDAGLGRDAWTTLDKIALSYHEVSSQQDARMRNLYANPNLNFAPRPVAIAQGANAGAGVSLPVPPRPSQTAAAMPAPQPPAAGGGPAQPVTAASGSSLNAQPPEVGKLFNEQRLTMVEHIAQLQAGLGQADFQKLDKYVRRLYAKAGREIFVAKGPQPAAGSGQPNTPPSAAQ
jgi:hypothetical protein